MEYPMTRDDIDAIREEAERRKDKRQRGLDGKFFVARMDGRDQPGEKHEGCHYFVLDMTHDPFAIPALTAYAEACRSEYPLLAADLDRLCANPQS